MPSSRLASSTTRSRMTSGSRRAAIRAVMSRSDRSVSARWATARLRPLQLLDEPGVGDRDGRLVGEAAEDRRVDLVERVRLAAEDLDRAERPLVADDRRDDEVADAGRPGQLVGRGHRG